MLSAPGPLLACGSTIDAFGLRTLKPHLKPDEKNAETRRRLLEAAILCVIERGYANTTGSEIAERAGLSRGAQLYHFPTREGLLVKAVEHLSELIVSEMRQKVEQLPVEADRRSLAIDLIWETVNGPLYQAWLELVIAGRTDTYLRNSIRAVHTRLSESMEKTLSGLLVPLEAREKRVIEQVLDAAKHICEALFIPRSG